MIEIKRQMRRGFTLIELMIAIAILAIISVVVVPNFLSYLEDAKQSQAKQMVTNLNTGVRDYNIRMNKWPGRLADLVKPPTDPKDKAKWPEGGYLEGKKEIPDDPWGFKYQYKVNQPGSDHPYELYSYGGSEGKDTPKEKRIDVWKND